MEIKNLEMETNNLELEIKKILLAGIHKQNYPISQGIEELLRSLLILYKGSSREKRYMESAAQYIYAYLQLGFGYLEHKELFDFVLQEAGVSSSVIAKLQMRNPIIIANKYQLRSIIGKWPVSSHNSHKITEVIADIIRHVENRDIGSYQYFTAKKDGTYTALYQLSISTDGILFHDVFRNRFYQLRKE